MSIPPRQTRRDFLTECASAATMIAGVDLGALAASSVEGQTDDAAAGASQAVPWYRRAVRWGQTNIREIDSTDYDVTWWRQHWKRTQTQGVIINAGGIVAYYPSKFPLHYRAAGLGDRDLYGEIARAAH